MILRFFVSSSLFAENVHKDNLRISSYVKYKKLIKYVVAELGDVWLQKLTPEQVRKFYTKKCKDGLSSKTVHDIHGVLHEALKNTVRWGYVARNVCDLVDRPMIVSREVTPLSSLRNCLKKLVYLTCISMTSGIMQQRYF